MAIVVAGSHNADNRNGGLHSAIQFYTYTSPIQ